MNDNKHSTNLPYLHLTNVHIFVESKKDCFQVELKQTIFQSTGVRMKNIQAFDWKVEINVI